MSKYATIDYGTTPPRIDAPRDYNAPVELLDRNLERGVWNNEAMRSGMGQHLHAVGFESGHALRHYGAVERRGDRARRYACSL